MQERDPVQAQPPALASAPSSRLGISVRGTEAKILASGLEPEGAPEERSGAQTESGPTSQHCLLGKPLLFPVPQFAHLLNGDEEMPGKFPVGVMLGVTCALTGLISGALLSCPRFANG